MTNLHHIGPDGSKPMGRQQVSPGPRMILDTCYTRWKLGRVSKENRNLVQRAFWKIRALMKDPLYKEMSCPSRLGLLKRIPIRKRLLHQGGEATYYYYKSPNTLTNQGMHNLPSLTLQSRENNFNLTFGGYLAGITLILSVRSSIILLCRSTLNVRVLHDLLVIVSASSIRFMETREDMEKWSYCLKL